MTPMGETRELLGDVHLAQGNMHIWCDTGYIYPGKQVRAYGNVQMLQDDSVRIFSDSLFYDGVSRQAELKKDVVLEDGRATMYTNVLYYDLQTRIARYPYGATILGDSAQLISRSGYYDANTNMAYFNDSVSIAHPDYKLYARDTLSFDMDTETAYFHGPTYIYDTSRIVYCESGYYDSKKNKAEFSKNAYYLNRTDEKSEKAEADRIIFDGKTESYYLIGNAHFKDDNQEAYADSILYDGRTEQYDFRGNPRFVGLDSTKNQTIVAKNSTYNAATKTVEFRGDVEVIEENQRLVADSLDYSRDKKSAIARGNVVWTDTVANTEIRCGEVFYDNANDKIIASETPVLTTLLDKDSLWLTADTLISLPYALDKEKRVLHAYRNARFYKTDVQGYCDSLVYNEGDSTFCFYQNPILWVDSVQFTADTIRALLASKRINQVQLYPNSLIVNSRDEVYFNQIKGNRVKAYFSDNKLQNMDIRGSGEAVYYALDNVNAYVGVNDVDCSDMFIYFRDNNVQRIKFTGTPQAVMYPMGQAPHKKLELKGFQWFEDLRPKGKWAIVKQLTIDN